MGGKEEKDQHAPIMVSSRKHSQTHAFHFSLHFTPAAMPSSRRSPQPRDRTQVVHTAGGFYLPSKPPGNPKNPGVECHFLLQGIFPTKTSNQHLLCLLNWQAGSLPLVPPGKHLVHKVYLCITCFFFFFFFFFDLTVQHTGSSSTRDGTHNYCIGSTEP